jgi:cobalt/nickel transport system permease protein
VADLELPAWLAATEAYEPRKDRDRFIERSALALVGALAAFRERSRARSLGYALHPTLKLLSLLLIAVLTSLSRGWPFLCLAAALVLGCLSLLRAEDIARTLKRALAAGALAAAAFLPAVLWGMGPRALASGAKTMLAVLAACVFSATTGWAELSAAFASLRVPGVFIAVLDTAVKYIVVLGEVALDLIHALRLRSVGRDDRKMRSLSGVAGAVFLKSKAAMEDAAAAMACRLYDDRRRAARLPRLALSDAALAAADLAAVAAFAVAGGVA